jgi:hypothetical protein
MWSNQARRLNIRIIVRTLEDGMVSKWEPGAVHASDPEESFRITLLLLKELQAERLSIDDIVVGDSSWGILPGREDALGAMRVAMAKGP